VPCQLRYVAKKGDAMELSVGHILTCLKM
jgi:hypothetical protein